MKMGLTNVLHLYCLTLCGKGVGVLSNQSGLLVMVPVVFLAGGWVLLESAKKNVILQCDLEWQKD